MDFDAGLGRLEHVLGCGRVVTSLKAIYVKPSVTLSILCLRWLNSSIFRKTNRAFYTRSMPPWSDVRQYAGIHDSYTQSLSLIHI